MQNIKIAIIGLGYVGLPLARLFATKYPVIGLDTDCFPPAPNTVQCTRYS